MCNVNVLNSHFSSTLELHWNIKKLNKRKYESLFKNVISLPPSHKVVKSLSKRTFFHKSQNLGYYKFDSL